MKESGGIHTPAEKILDLLKELKDIVENTET